MMGGKEISERNYVLESRNQYQQFSEDRNEEDDKKSSMHYASFNFINSIIGSGVIGIPYALHQAGFGFGVLLLVLVAYITDYSLILMIKAGHISGRFSYQGIMEAAFGRAGYILLGILQFVYPFIAMVSYNVVVGDTVTKVIIRLTDIEPDNIFAKREIIVLIATIFITVPLSLYRDIAKLAKISFFSLVCIGFILLSILLRIRTISKIVPDHPDSWRFFNSDIIPAVGIMAFAFMCHHNTFLIYSSIADTSQKKWETVTHASILTSLIVSCIFGIAGYATFKAYCQGDLLENYCWDDDLMNASRILFSIQILLTYPIECFVTRGVIENSIISKDPNVPMSERTHYAITLSIVFTTYFISMATDCLGVVLELNGVLAAVPLAFVLPAFCYLRLEEGRIFDRNKLPALGVAFFGLSVTTLGVIFLFMDIDQINQCSHGVVMDYCSLRYLNVTQNSTEI
ncbi:putative sodium-coupled neutral amino acid transporter 11 isoform X2 [Dendroctonus ponderosae]|uniref:putative sodium-coupled neutral amino acid transporter 11 isoform X2 n=1 Tax=Dendroctonus ponderosae TaxID=77166 RepID=UPI00203609DF|nr:putative sodium-coupled neutral amino acid transporter 11 isoform X2 [Dendroctonus ponderosae]